ncbi:anthranilate synthase component I [Bacillus xiapuensis]|uniref:anthranilate synthase component I n=1 Tax=Bacillus xiapuensis TaxID=2014075 RepID=UPI001E617883|nr:anthranilate synthase component I [Bacillus xiapuensis]
MLTPIMLYHQLDGDRKFLFESSYKHKQSGRYSFIGMNPIQEYKATGSQVELVNDQKETVYKRKGHGLKELKYFFSKKKLADSPFPFFGGAVGYIGYDVMFLDEVIGEMLEDELQMPDIHFMIYDTFIVYDHLLQKIIIAAVDLFGERTEKDMEEAIAEYEKCIEKPSAGCAADSFEPLHFKGNLSKTFFNRMVEEAKSHIIRGDVFQVVLSQRLTAVFSGDPFSLYRRLRTSNPSPYMFFLDFHEYTVLGASPESLLRVRGNQVMANPIAGTRPRGKDEQEDRLLEEELLNDQKEIAEHRMLVDLSRNDLGKVCKLGSIKLTKFQKIEKYKYVMHLVSEVSGTLKADTHPVEALAAALPAGTVSGAPKIRAMQIINELEPVKRGLYAGAVGYISSNGDLDFALAIRTMIIKDAKAYVQAGAGIVYDSIPKKEYEETINKAKALLEVK